MYRVFAAIVLVAMVGGCTALSSETADDLIARDRAAKGVAYSLPRGVNPVVLTVFPKSAVFKLRVKQPKYVPDSRHTYFMRYRPLPNYSDEISIEVGPKSFIKSIKATLEDRTPQIILKAFGGDPSVIKAEEAPDPKGDVEITLAQDEVDLLDERDLSRSLSRLNSILRQFAGSMRDKKCASDLPEEVRLKPLVCREYMNLAVAKRPLRLGIQGRGRYVDQFPTRPADCTRGICYRVPLSYRVVARIGSESSASGFVELPNESPPVLIDINRTFAVKKIKNIYFDEDSGRLQKVFVKKPSSLEAVAKLPLEIARQIIKVPTELIQLRVALVGQQTALATKTAELAAAQNALIKARQETVVITEEADQGEPPSNPKTVPASSELVLSVVNASQLAVVPLQ